MATVAMTKILSIHFVGFSSLVTSSHILPQNMITLAHNPFYKLSLKICCYDNSCHLRNDFPKKIGKMKVSSIIYCHNKETSCNHYQKYLSKVFVREVLNCKNWVSSTLSLSQNVCHQI